MNLQQFPKDLKDDIENQSLRTLEIIRDDILVIGGWAVRALIGERHTRYTIDVDGVASSEKLPEVQRRIEEIGLAPKIMDWGIRFHKKYVPKVKVIDKTIRKQVDGIEIRIEISEPRMPDIDGKHYFEFDLDEYTTKDLRFRGEDSIITVKVPTIAYMAANKLGVPADFGHRFDSAMLMEICDMNEVVETIERIDDWNEKVLKRIPKDRGRMKNPKAWEKAAFQNVGIDVKEYLNKLDFIETSLRSQ